MKPQPDPTTPERFPAIFVKTQCPVCPTCWLDRRTGRCLCNGPYAGYQPAAESTTPA